MNTADTPLFPDAVYTIWWIGLILTLVVFVPLSVYSLNRTYRAARSIQRYAADTMKAATGVAGNTQHIPALDATIATATKILGTASTVERKLATIADVLAQRAS